MSTPRSVTPQLERLARELEDMAERKEPMWGCAEWAARWLRERVQQGRDRNWITDRAFTPEHVGSSPTGPTQTPDRTDYPDPERR